MNVVEKVVDPGGTPHVGLVTVVIIVGVHVESLSRTPSGLMLCVVRGCPEDLPRCLPPYLLHPLPVGPLTHHGLMDAILLSKLLLLDHVVANIGVEAQKSGPNVIGDAKGKVALELDIVPLEASSRCPVLTHSTLVCCSRMAGLHTRQTDDPFALVCVDMFSHFHWLFAFVGMSSAPVCRSNALAGRARLGRCLSGLRWAC